MQGKSLVVRNPQVVLREEYDDWAILFHPDTGATFGINPTGALVFGLLDGSRTVSDVVAELAGYCSDVPPDSERIVGEFLEELIARGMAELQDAGGR